MNFVDGFNSNYKSQEQSSEDFILLNGKYYKVDITRMNYTKTDYLQPKSIYTVSSTESVQKTFKDRHCEMTFDPHGMVEEGVNLGLIAMK